MLHNRKTKAEIETGNTIEYAVTSYQSKKTMVKSTEVQLKEFEAVRIFG